MTVRASRLIVPMMLAAGAGACAQTPPQPTTFATAGPPPVCAASAPAPAIAPPGEIRKLVPGKPKNIRGKRTATARTVNAVTVYPYQDGVIYRVATTPDFFTSIHLQPGEQVIGKMLGNPDPVDWMVNETAAGPQGSRMPIVTVKPGTPGISTNLLITTNFRTYQIDLKSYAKRAMDSVKWTYPNGGFIASSGQPHTNVSQDGIVMQAAFDPMSINRGYTIEVVRGDRPKWTPVAAYDVGAKTYLEFPADIGRIPAPPLFVINEGGLASPVTFRPRGRFYEIDQVFSRAELRMANPDGDTVVRIERQT